MTVAKRGGVLVCLGAEGPESRNQSTMWCIQQADAIYKWPDFDPVDIHTEDKGAGETCLAYNKVDPSGAVYDTLVPDFTFHCWAETRMMDYERTMAEIDAAGRLPAKVQKVGWIGNIATNPRRRVLFDIGQQHPQHLDIRSMEWCGDAQAAFLSPVEQTATYAALIDIEGNGWSARTKYFFWSHRPLLLVDRPHKEYFYEHLRPWVHYIPVARDLSDLLEKVEWVFANPDAAQRIADAAYAFACEHLTRAAAYKQFDRVIRGLASKVDSRI